MLVPCLRPSHWLAFLPGLVGQTVLEGLPSVRPQVAPPAGSLQCWPEHLSLPESNALGGGSIDKGNSFRQLDSMQTEIYTKPTRHIYCKYLFFDVYLSNITENRHLVAVSKERQVLTFSQLHFLVQLVLVREQGKSRCWPVAVISVVFGSRVDHWTGLHTDLLEQVPHLLIDVLLQTDRQSDDLISR